jgi:hypothetical protein
MLICLSTPHRWYLRPLHSKHLHPCRLAVQNSFTPGPLGHPGRGRATLNVSVAFSYSRAQRVPYYVKSICYDQNSQVHRRPRGPQNAFGGRMD